MPVRVKVLVAVWLLTCLLQAQPLPDLRVQENWPEQAAIFHPSGGRSVAPKGVRELYFRTQDGIRLQAWWLPARPGAMTVLHFHGTFGNLSSTVSTLQTFQQAGLGAFAVDYRGYGLSQGRPCEEGVYRDARAAYAEVLKLGVRPEQLIVHGHSLGGAIAVQLASQRTCAGVVLESTFTNAQAIGLLHHGLAALSIHTRFDNLTSIAKLKVPILIIHGSHDTVIPCAMGQTLFNAAPLPKEMWLVPGGGHGDLTGEEYARRLSLFAKRCRTRKSK